MEYQSTLYHMLNNPNHEGFSYDEYHLVENTIYQRYYFYRQPIRRWFMDKGFTLEEIDEGIYKPIARKEGKHYIGWRGDKANPSVYFLNLDHREIWYPNLFFVEQGINPYPKELRQHVNWTEELYHRECDMLFLPHHDPKQWFKTKEQLEALQGY